MSTILSKLVFRRFLLACDFKDSMLPSFWGCSSCVISDRQACVGSVEGTKYSERPRQVLQGSVPVDGQIATSFIKLGGSN